jgi:uncharacterized protein (TIGR00296 family)
MDEYINLAKNAVENYFKAGKIIAAPQSLPEEFYSRRAGVFVTIYNDKELKGLPRSHAKRVLQGCIGTFLPTKKNIAEEIISNAIAACSRDYRFSPITPEELPEISYEVSILSKPELIKDLKNHDPKEHGIIVKCADGRCGLLLPDLEGVDTTGQQIYIACQKGGINPEMDKTELWEFKVEKHS